MLKCYKINHIDHCLFKAGESVKNGFFSLIDILYDLVDTSDTLTH